MAVAMAAAGPEGKSRDGQGRSARAEHSEKQNKY